MRVVDHILLDVSQGWQSISPFSHRKRSQPVCHAVQHASIFVFQNYYLVTAVVVVVVAKVHSRDGAVLADERRGECRQSLHDRHGEAGQTKQKQYRDSRRAVEALAEI